MRPALLDPLASHPRLQDAIALAHVIYARHEEGADCSDSIRECAKLVGRPIHLHEVHAAFGSVRPETFAKRLLTNWNTLPSDATEAEMLEMIERICNAGGSEFQMDYWLQCLRVNTGNPGIRDLIFWPEQYLGREVPNDLSPNEILQLALQKKGERNAV